MKKMKKAISLLLAILLMIGFTACNDTAEPDGGKPSAAITRTELVDEADVKIVALRFSEKTIVGPELQLQIENKTDKKLVFQSYNTAINHYMVDSVMSVEVEAGQKEKCAMIFSNTDIQACGISSVALMEMAFRVVDAGNWKPYLDTETVKLETTAAKDFTYTFQHEGVTAYEENGVKILVKEPVEQGGAQVYIHNGGKDVVAVQISRCIIGGVEIDSQFYEEIPAGKHIVTEVVFAEEILEDSGITEITEMEIAFELLDENGEVVTEIPAVKPKVQ